MITLYCYTLAFFDSGSPSEASLASLSLSYPPSAPSVGAGAGAGLFLLLLSGAGGTDGLAGWSLTGAFVAGAVGPDSVVSLGLGSFFLMTPFNSDLTFFLVGAVPGGGGLEAAAATEGTTGAGGATSAGGDINPPCLLCNFLRSHESRTASLQAPAYSLERRQLLGILHLDLSLLLPFHARRLVQELKLIGFQSPELIRHAHLGVPFFLFHFFLSAQALNGGVRS